MYTETIAGIAGVTPKTVLQLRQEGYGCGQITRRLNVHQDTAGLQYGHSKNSKVNIGDQIPDPDDQDLNEDLVEDIEIMEATRRNLKADWDTATKSIKVKKAVPTPRSALVN